MEGNHDQGGATSGDVAACLGAVPASGRQEKAPRGLPEGRWRRNWIRYLPVTSDSARWKNRARPRTRRVIFAACVSESLNADFNSAAITFCFDAVPFLTGSSISTRHVHS